MTGKEFNKLVDDFRLNEDRDISLMEFCSEEYTFGDLEWIRVGDSGYGKESEYREWICRYQNQYFRITGYYASYAGYEITDDKFVEVTPHTISITVFK